jgi:Flp pilus assembly protein TadG
MLKSIYHKFLSDQAGAIAIIVGLLMPVVVGGWALGAEVGYWYFNQRKLQNSADVAAYAGAVELRAGQDQQTIADAAFAAAAKTGYKESIGTLTVSSPPTTGAFAGDPNVVEVIAQENVLSLFSAFFTDVDVPMSGRAVARVMEGQAVCILALDTSASGAVTFTGSSNTILENCNVHANSVANDAIAVTGDSYVETPCASAVGYVSASSGLVMGECTYPIEHGYPINDPYADVLEPMPSDICKEVNVFAGPPNESYTISPGNYCGGLTIKRTVTMDSGVYVVDGGNLTIESTAVVNGTAGVTFFLTGGASVNIAGTANVILSAPPSGEPYAGILIFGDRDDLDANHIINGDSESYFDGAIYAPSGHVEFAGSSTVGGGCTQVVAATIEFTGDAGIGTDCSGTGVNEIETNQLVKLVE